MKSTRRTRTGDATFELNLAPFLDIIVAIIPMLLLSVAFIQVKMIEAPTPQVVQSTESNPPKPQTQILLKISKSSGFLFEVTDKNGRTSTKKVDNTTTQELNYEGLLAAAISIKETYPEVVQLQLAPEADVDFDSIVKTMDQVRMKLRTEPIKKASLMDAASSKPAEPDYLFPDVIFASVGG